MTVTMNGKTNEVKAVAKLAMKDMYKNGAKVETKEDIYNTVCDYVQITKEQFEQLYEDAQVAVNEGFWGTEELAEEDLDMVVGGYMDWMKFGIGVAATILGLATVVLGAAITALGAPVIGVPIIAVGAACTGVGVYALSTCTDVNVVVKNA